MGDPRRLRKTYSSPRRPWDKVRVVAERETLDKYGLSAKRELRVAEETIRKKRHSAKLLLAATKETSTESLSELISSLNRMGLVSQDATLMDVLGLTTIDLLERRLQTIVYRMGLANSLKQARQFILHGFIVIDDRRVRSPSYIVKREEEAKIGHFENKRPKVLDFISKAPELQKKKDEAKVEDAKTEGTADEKLEEAIKSGEVIATEAVQAE